MCLKKDGDASRKVSSCVSEAQETGQPFLSPDIEGTGYDNQKWMWLSNYQPEDEATTWGSLRLRDAEGSGTRALQLPRLGLSCHGCHREAWREGVPPLHKNSLLSIGWRRPSSLSKFPFCLSLPCCITYKADLSGPYKQACCSFRSRANGSTPQELRGKRTVKQDH